MNFEKKILDIRNEIDVWNLIYKNYKYKLYFFIFLDVLSALNCLVSFFYKNEKYILLSCTIYVFILFIQTFVFIVPYAKKQMLKLGLKINKGFFKPWYSEEYFEYQGNLYTDLFFENKLLIKNDIKTNIDLLDTYISFFEKESKKNDRVKIGS